ncbi:MAG TPA: permease [Candidatus Eisenbacteria bacterium]|nr:permease [Candidatus Eisenbacteria bacterium]
MEPTGIVAAVWRVFLDASLEIVPLFLVALILAAVLEEFVSNRTIERFLTGRHPATMLVASTTGALIPLCTCGMVPLAVTLRRRGSDLKHTFAFLTAGAAVSVPVLLLTWKVLGPGWMAVRLLTSVLYGLFVGYLAVRLLRSVAERSAGSPPGPVQGPIVPPADLTEAERTLPVQEIRTRSRLERVLRRLRGQLIEYGPWVLVSLALAAIVDVLVPRHVVHLLYGQKTLAGSFLAALTGVPFYFCSGAELPLVEELLTKGMGRGPATSMLLAVPIVNILTFGVVSRWLGPRGAFVYLALCVAGSTLIGAVTGWIWA